MKKLSKNAKIMMIVIAAFVVAIISIYLIGSKHFSTHFFPGTVINGIDCGEKTVEEVKADLQDKISEYTLTVTERDGKTEEITAEQLDMKYVDDGGVEKLLEEQDAAAWIVSVGNSKAYETTVSYTHLDVYKRQVLFTPREVHATSYFAASERIFSSSIRLICSVRIMAASINRTFVLL